MAALVKTRITTKEYLALERRAATKSEYYDGTILAMAGASRKHNLITTNLSREISTQLKGRPCESYSGDMRVFIPLTEAYVYPDLVVVCGEPLFEDGVLDTLLNPTLIIEVSSPSTAEFDKAGKFSQYRTIASLQEYVITAQHKCHILQHTRQPDGNWLPAEAQDMQSLIKLSSIGCSLALAEVYDKVKW